MDPVTPDSRRVFQEEKMAPAPHHSAAGMFDLLLSILMLATLTLLLTPGGLWTGFS